MAVRDWDPTPYPDPRMRRAEGGLLAGAGPEAMPVPLVRLWPFFARASLANTRATVVSPRMRGPALLASIHAHLVTGSASAPRRPISIVVSTDDGDGGNGLALTSVPSGASIFEANSFTDDGGATVGGMAGNIDLPHNVSEWMIERRTDYPVYLPEFFIKVSVFCVIATENYATGLMKILTFKSVEDLAEYMGA
jgi:hypothetical protein